MYRYEDYLEQRLQDEAYKHLRNSGLTTGAMYTDDVKSYWNAYKQAYLAYNYGEDIAKRLNNSNTPELYEGQFTKETLNKMLMNDWNSKAGHLAAKKTKESPIPGTSPNQQMLSILASDLSNKRLITNRNNTRNLSDFDTVFGLNKPATTNIANNMTKMANTTNTSNTTNTNLGGGLNSTSPLLTGGVQKNQSPFTKSENKKERMGKQDILDRIYCNTTDNTMPMTKWEKLLNWAISNRYTNHRYPTASDFYIDSTTDFSKARKNKNANILDNYSTLEPAVQKSLKDSGVKSTERGVTYNSKSKESKRFANSKEMKKELYKNYDKIASGEMNETYVDFRVPFWNAIVNRKAFDRYNSIQKAKLTNLHLDENGNITGNLIDNYDFELRKGENTQNSIKNIPNNFGYNMQNKGNAENYFVNMEFLVKYPWYKRLLRKLQKS